MIENRRSTLGLSLVETEGGAGEVDEAQIASGRLGVARGAGVEALEPV